MAAVERFEELRCWQSARELVKLVFQSCRSGELSKDFESRAQFKQAALSIMNNIAEGFGRRASDKDFIKFLRTSESSSYETKSMTYTFEDVGYLDTNVVTEIRGQTDKTTAQTVALIRYLKSRNRRG